MKRVVNLSAWSIPPNWLSCLFSRFFTRTGTISRPSIFTSKTESKYHPNNSTAASLTTKIVSSILFRRVIEWRRCTSRPHGGSRIGKASYRKIKKKLAAACLTQAIFREYSVESCYQCAGANILKERVLTLVQNALSRSPKDQNGSSGWVFIF